jgi:hypothetical protein
MPPRWRRSGIDRTNELGKCRGKNDPGVTESKAVQLVVGHVSNVSQIFFLFFGHVRNVPHDWARVDSSAMTVRKKNLTAGATSVAGLHLFH